MTTGELQNSGGTVKGNLLMFYFSSFFFLLESRQEDAPQKTVKKHVFGQKTP